MSKAKRVLKSILCFALVFVMGGGSILSAFSLTANAEETSFNIDTSSPLDDLKGAIVDGESFTLADYVPGKKTEKEVITLYEYGYSADTPEHFNLYFYVYSPVKDQCWGGTAEYADKTEFSVEMKIGNIDFFEYFKLELVNSAVDPYLNGVFYKFKLALGKNERVEVWSALSCEERVYQTRSISASNYNNGYGTQIIPYYGTFYYTGYMQGLHLSSAESSTLAARVDRENTVTLDVHSTSYDIGLNSNEDDSNAIDSVKKLHSVYFGVPNSLIDEYGEMSAVRASWVEALTAPALVIGDETVYNNVKKASLDTHVPECSYSFVSNVLTATDSCGYSFNFSRAGDYGVIKPITRLRLLFPTLPFGVDAADKYTVSATDIEKMLDERTQFHIKNHLSTTFTSPSGKEYSNALFESVSEKKVMTVYASDEFKLVGQVVSQSWWQSLWGNKTVHTVATPEFEGIQMISSSTFTLKALEEAKVKNRVDESYYAALKAKISENPENEAEIIRSDSLILSKYLGISQGDADNFLAYYDEKTANNETVYLFRYRTSDYLCEEACIYEEYDLNGDRVSRYLGTNAYFFQSSVDLGFDVLDLTLTKEGVDTVIPVVMNAKDLFFDATPPVNTTSDVADDESFVLDVLKVILIVIIVIVAFIGLSFAMPFISPVLSIFGDLIKTLFSLLLLPFRAIGNLFKRRR